MSSIYKCKELGEDHIRLFNLHPTVDKEDPLECTVRVYKRSANPKYEAVSYVWGTEDDHAVSLQVRNSDEEQSAGSKKFFIRPNLAAALKRFRSPFKDRLLWSDAICIDQDSVVEKSKQVPLMESTYVQAQRVLVWLGERTATSRQAIEFMHAMVDQDANIDELASDHADKWDAVVRLMRMSWFTRRWIVQEIALAREATVYCGDDNIRWLDFCESVEFFQAHYSKIRQLFLEPRFSYSRNRLGEINALGACRLVQITNNLFHKSADGSIIQRRLCTLESLVGSLTAFCAKNPRDIIYAMVALSKDLRTTNQKAHTVESEAQPVMTPPHTRDCDLSDSEEVSEPSRKRKRGCESSALVRMAWLKAAQQAVNALPLNTGLEDGGPPQKSQRRMEGVVRQLMRNRPPPFNVDYSRSFLRVCMDFVAFAILQSRSLDILCRPWVPAESECEDISDLPSWLISTDACPFRPRSDGTFVRVNGDPLVGENAMEPKRYSAAGAYAPAQRVTKQNPNEGWGFGIFDRPSLFDDGEHQHRSLFVSGLIVSTIKEIKNRAEDGTIPSEWFPFAGWYDRSQAPPDHLWRTLVADRRSDGGHIEAFYKRTIRNLVNRHAARNSAFNVKDILATPQSDKLSEQVLERILAIVPNRRLFKITVSKAGDLFGLAPAGAQSGDIVCILYGCSVPVVLRRHSTEIQGKNVEHFELVGDAYVHGMMGGEALDEPDISAQQFELR